MSLSGIYYYQEETAFYENAVSYLEITIYSFLHLMLGCDRSTLAWPH